LAEGGRLVAPVGEKYQTLQLVEKLDGRLVYHAVDPGRGFDAWFWAYRQ
jgi:protein-L-isoaspartate O-methyltransferase